MDGASSVPTPKKRFSLEIANHCERTRPANLVRRTNEEAAYPKAGGLTLRFIKSVVEAFGEGRRGHGPRGRRMQTALRGQAVENGFSTACWASDSLTTATGSRVTPCSRVGLAHVSPRTSRRRDRRLLAARCPRPENLRLLHCHRRELRLHRLD